MSYDSAGNLTADKDGYEYQYDYENRIVKITKDGNDIAEDVYGSPYILEPNFAADPDGKSDVGNPYLFTGRRVDFLDNGSLTLQYNRHRYYDYYTGRWTTQDPLGIDPAGLSTNPFTAHRQYGEDLNLYGYAGGNPVGRRDPVGLATRSDVEAGRVQYSCNCGWIDWGHAGERTAPYWLALQSETGLASVDRPGFKVSPSMSHHRFGVSHGVHLERFVKYGLTLAQKESVALGIFRELSWRFESLQSRWYYRSFTTSGFSEEDLPSNLLGFYRRVRSVTLGNIRSDCEVLDQEGESGCSLCIWNETGGTRRYKPEWVGNHWVPRYHHTDSVTAECACERTSKTWPATFALIPSEPKGTLWDDWRYGYIFGEYDESYDAEDIVGME